MYSKHIKTTCACDQPQKVELMAIRKPSKNLQRKHKLAVKNRLSYYIFGFILNTWRKLCCQMRI